MSRQIIGLLKGMLPRTALWQVALGVAVALAQVQNATAGGVNLGTFTSSSTPYSVTKYGSISSSNPEDVWTITFTEQATGTIDLSSLTADLDLEFRWNTEVFARSEKSGTLPERITFTVDAGTYNVPVYRYENAQSSYSLRLAFTVAAANDSPGTAHDLGTYETRSTAYSVTRYNWVGGVDPVDYFKITFKGKATGTVTLSDLGADLDLGFNTVTSEKGGTQSESISFSVPAGTYLVKVPPYLSARSEYTLSLNFTVATTPADYEPVFDIGNNPSQSHTKSIGTQAVGTVHWYKFTITPLFNSTGGMLRGRAFAAVLSNMSIDLDIELHDGSKTGPIRKSSRNSGTSIDSISFRNVGTEYLPNGTYYLRVFRKANSGSSSYKLQVSTQQAL